MSDSEPIAWAVLLQGGDRIYDVYAIEEEAKAIDEVVTGNHGIVPLYRSPALTDEERHAIAVVRNCAMTRAERFLTQSDAEREATLVLWRLRERLG